MATIRKRGPYQYQVQIRKKGFPVQSRTFETKEEAKDWATVIESEMTRGTFIDRSLAESTTLGEVIDTYIEDTAPEHKGYESEKLRLEQFKRQNTKLCQYSVANLKTKHFMAFRNRRLKKVSPATVCRDLGLLHTVLEEARRDLSMVGNPISDVKRPRVSNKRDVRFQKDEEAKLMEALDTCRNPWVKPAVILALETAMRRSELLALNWDDINLEDRVAKLHDTKNGDSREVPLSSIAIEILKSLPQSIDGRVLATSAEGIKNAFERARKKADMEHFNFHDLRHEATSRLFEWGWNIMEVSAVTGHKDLQSLKRYTNLRGTDLAKKMNRTRPDNL